MQVMHNNSNESLPAGGIKCTTNTVTCTGCVVDDFILNVFITGNEKILKNKTEE